MSVFQTMVIMITFATLVVMILDHIRKLGIRHVFGRNALVALMQKENMDIFSLQQK